VPVAALLAQKKRCKSVNTTDRPTETFFPLKKGKKTLDFLHTKYLIFVFLSITFSRTLGSPSRGRIHLGIVSLYQAHPIPSHAPKPVNPVKGSKAVVG
jgi:hypothetical protein